MVVLNYADVLNGIGFILGPKFGIAMQMQPKFATTLLEFSLSEYEIFFIGQCTKTYVKSKLFFNSPKPWRVLETTFLLLLSFFLPFAY